jgi:hypothetical protein
MFLIRQTLHVSGLTGPSSGSAQLHKTVVFNVCIIISSMQQSCRKFVSVCLVVDGFVHSIGVACWFECVHGTVNTFMTIHLCASDLPVMLSGVPSYEAS